MNQRQVVRAAIGITAYLLLAPALLFVAAGTIRWPMAWVYVTLTLAATIGSRLLVWRTNPDTLRERARFTSGEGAAPWDRYLVLVVGVLGPVVLVVGYGLGVWAMVENAYFAAVVRIQAERGQIVISTGPYAVVRHPSYTGAILGALAIPVMLGTLWAWVPAVAMAVAVVVRTALEDRMLRDELEGYATYAERVRWRLLPGVW